MAAPIRSRAAIAAIGLALTLPLLAGCQSAYYAAMEKVGFEKRDILSSRVKSARDAQQEAKEEIKDALTVFSETVNYSGGKLEAQYKALGGQLEDSEAAAEEVRERVRDVESVAKALFDEWQRELSQYNNADLRRRSEQQLAGTRERYARMISAMKAAEQRLEPALRPLRDQVLFLKHNLNARALASLQGEVAKVDVQVDRLVADIEKAVAEADRFIAAIDGPAD